MRPVREFQGNFSRAEPVADSRSNDLTDAITSHEHDSTVRNLCLVWPDGRRAFFNYAYLVVGDLTLTDSLNIIVLYFSGHIVTLKGYQLGLLFDLLLQHIPKTVRAANPRYHVYGRNLETLVTEIIVNIE